MNDVPKTTNAYNHENLFCFPYMHMYIGIQMYKTLKLIQDNLYFFSVLKDEAAERCSMFYRAPELFNVEVGSSVDERTDIWVR